ncbi:MULTISPECIES: OmpW/AlkL family protein [Oceanospirillaceae]|uniref:OmpW family outer membrane protein n=1 Tax=Oceanobacter antarcticus TaxID=3133425 RepID=A0ABW8NHL4_9GAMM
MNNTKPLAGLVIIAILGISMTARAENSRWGGYLGAAYVSFDTDVTAYAGGIEVSGGNADTTNNIGLAFGVTYDISPQWVAKLALGLPMTTKLTGVGALESAGELGKVSYGPAILSVSHYFNTNSMVKPYLGVGYNYTLITDTEDGFISEFEVNDATGAVLVAGLKAMISNRLELIIDINKVFLKTTATGTLPAMGGARADADIRLNPTITTVGLRTHF